MLFKSIFAVNKIRQIDRWCGNRCGYLKNEHQHQYLDKAYVDKQIGNINLGKNVFLWLSNGKFDRFRAPNSQPCPRPSTGTQAYANEIQVNRSHSRETNQDKTIG